MKMITAIAIVFVALVGSSYVGHVGAAPVPAFAAAEYTGSDVLVDKAVTDISGFVGKPSDYPNTATLKVVIINDLKVYTMALGSQGAIDTETAKAFMDQVYKRLAFAYGIDQ